VEIGNEGSTLTAIENAQIQVIGKSKLIYQRIKRFPASNAAWEAIEAMPVMLEMPLYVADHQNLQRAGELDVSIDAEVWQPTERVKPGSAAKTMLERNRQRLLKLDDGDLRDSPAGVRYLPEPISDQKPLRIGSKIHRVQGVVDQRNHQYRLQLTQVLGRIEHAPRPALPSVSGSLRIGALNVLNLFNGDGQGGDFPTARGAQSRAQYERQQSKLVRVMKELNADVIGLMEVENDGDDPRSALAQLVAQMNRDSGSSDWAFVTSKESPGTQSIRVALIYRSSKVLPLGEARYLHGGPFGPQSRPALLQNFQSRKTGKAFAVTVNHFKSKGCGRGVDQAKAADEDQRDGQACFNDQRLKSSEALLRWLPSVVHPNAQTRIAIIGDLNAYGMEDPIQRLIQGGYVDAFAHSKQTDGAPYSFVFQGQRGRLDHALISKSMLPYLRGAAEWHINAAEWEGFDYQKDQDNDVWRSADHDPLLLGFDL
jgi:uncharacterized protein